MTSVAFPSGFDSSRLLEPMLSSAMESSSHYRRAVTETDPIRFALVFLPRHLSSPSTGGQISFSEFHLDMAKRARRWMRDEPRRDIWIAPRGAAKSTWNFLILPLWCLAHGHRNTFMAFAHSSQQSAAHLANIRRELADNELLLRDFPELRPKRGQGSSNSSQTVSTAGGRTFAARGVDSGALGTKFGNERVGHLVMDDIEPDASNYSPTGKEKRLATLLNAVLPMGERNTVVQMAGTVTMHGSIMHDAVQHAVGERRVEWIADEGFRVHYHRPIIEHADGSRASMWPARWPLDYLESIEHTRSFALNFLNQPSAVGDGAHWNKSLFRHEEIPVVRRVLAVDPAVTSRAGSDFTAIAVVGVDGSGRRFSVDYARQFKITPGGLRDKVHALCVQNPDLREVQVETNQGGSTWGEILSPLPNGARLVEYRVSAPKHVRLAKLLSRYEAGQVVHSAPLRELEDQLLAYPSPAAHDDLADATENAIAHLTRGSR